MLGAPALKAIDDFEKGVIIQDHNRCAKLCTEISQLQSFQINGEIQTNIIFIKIVTHEGITKNNITTFQVSNIFREKGVLISAWDSTFIRIVIHRDIIDEHIDKIIQSFIDIDNYLISLKH